MKHSIAASLLAASLLVSGCYRTQIVNGNAVATPMPAPGYDQRFNHNLIAGLVNYSGPVELDSVCPGGWAKVEVQKNIISIAIDYVLSALTVGALYTPQNVSVWCTDGKGAHLFLDKNGKVLGSKIIGKR